LPVVIGHWSLSHFLELSDINIPLRSMTNDLMTFVLLTFVLMTNDLMTFVLMTFVSMTNDLMIIDLPFKN